MSKVRQVYNWRPAYNALRSVGMKDKEIGELAGVSRAVVSAVANNKYASEHHLGFNGGIRVLTKLKELKDNGQLPDFIFDSLGTDTGSKGRPAGDNPGA